MEICTECGLPIKGRDTVWLEQQTAKQTHASPAEYSCDPFCATCANEIEHQAQKDDFDLAYDKAAARYSGDGRGWR